MLTNSIIRAIDEIAMERGAQEFIRWYEEQHGFVPPSDVPMSELMAMADSDSEMDRLSNYTLIAIYKRCHS